MMLVPLIRKATQDAECGSVAGCLLEGFFFFFRGTNGFSLYRSSPDSSCCTRFSSFSATFCFISSL